MNPAFFLHIILYVKNTLLWILLKRKKPYTYSKNSGRWNLGKIIIFLLYLMNCYQFSQITWNVKSQSNCATRSYKVVGLLVNLEIIDIRLSSTLNIISQLDFTSIQPNLVFPLSESPCVILQLLPPSSRSLHQLPPAEDFWLLPSMATYHWCYNRWFAYSLYLAVSSLRAKTKGGPFCTSDVDCIHAYQQSI